MTTLLGDETTYRILTKDPINRITSRLNELVKVWRDNDIINDFVYKKLNCTNGNLPRCYGQPKIHKKDFPLRIIVSTLGSPLYNISHFLHSILDKSIVKPNSFIKDSWSFAKVINDYHIQNDEIMISLDVTSLFTNIPTQLVLQAIKNRWDLISTKTSMSINQFLHAIQLILESTSFKFNDVIYEQIFGSPMGSPLSPMLADIVMDDLESHCLEALPFDVRVFYRYVDDIFAIIPIANVDQILSIFNSYHPRLQFTYETEQSGKLSFLDTIVIRDGNNLITDWYRKPTFSGRYINYYSNHPLKYKTNTIINLVDRAILLANERFHIHNINEVKKILINNSYPTCLIDKHIRARMKQLFSIETNIHVPERSIFHVILLPFHILKDLVRVLPESCAN